MEHKNIVMPTPEAWFVRELRLVSPDLRMVWGREQFGWDCWVIQRRIPNGEWRRIYADAIEQNQERFIHQKMSDGTGRYYDTMPTWQAVHFCKDADDRPRPPDRRDLVSIRRWMFEFKSIEEQNRADDARRESIEARGAEARADRIAYEAVHNRRWTNPVTGEDESDPYVGQPAKIMEGTDCYETQQT